eukprot:360459-Chlamydomonas_euryale.AAC.2
MRARTCTKKRLPCAVPPMNPWAEFPVAIAYPTDHQHRVHSSTFTMFFSRMFLSARVAGKGALACNPMATQPFS